MVVGSHGISLEDKDRMKPFFSVIIPVYNVGSYLRDCMQSVIVQKFSGWEAVLVDDGSTDSSGRLCDEWGLKDSRIRVIHQENKGLACARNTGMQAAAGEWLLFLDSDDFWKSDFLERLYTHISSHTEIDVHIGYYSLVSAEGACICEQACPKFVKGAAPDGTLQKRFDYYYNMVDVAAWKMAVRHTWQKEKQLWFVQEVKYAEDVVWSLQLFQLYPKIYYVDIPFVMYRVDRAGSLTTTNRPPIRNFESRIIAWKQFINGGRFANGSDDDLYACTFAANKVIGEFQSQIKKAPCKDEQYLRTMEMMKKNINAARNVFFGQISMKRYIVAKLCMVLKPYLFGVAIRGQKKLFEIFS